MYTIMVEQVGDSENFTLFEKTYCSKRYAIWYFKKICYDYWLAAKNLDHSEKTPSIRGKDYSKIGMWEMWINENNTHYPYIVTFMVDD